MEPIKLHCVICGDPFELQEKHPNQICCSQKCAGRYRWFFRDRKTIIDKSRPSGKVASVRHPLSSLHGHISEHRAVLYNKIGPGPHKCHWCNCIVSWDGSVGKKLHTDHLDENHMNNDPDNLVPSCSRCNNWRSHPKRIKEGELTMMHQGRPHRAVEKTCPVCDKTFLALPSQDQVYCSRQCAGKISGKKVRTKYIEKNCEYCGKPFMSYASDHKRFCSMSCAAHGRSRPPRRTPERGLGRVSRFWIKEGELTMMHQGRLKRAAEKNCEHCGKPFLSLPSAKQRFCSPACGAAHKRKPRKP